MDDHSRDLRSNRQSSGNAGHRKVEPHQARPQRVHCNDVECFDGGNDGEDDGESEVDMIQSGRAEVGIRNVLSKE